MSKKNKSLVRTKKKEKKQVKWANPKMRRLIGYLAQGDDVYEAGRKAGYSESYVRTRLHSMMLHSPTFHRLVESMAETNVDAVKNLFRLNLLPRAFKCDSRILSEIEKNPELGMKYPQSLNRVHKIAGTLKEEVAKVQFIDVKVAVAVQESLAVQQTQKVEMIEGGEIVDGEVIEESHG